MAAGATGYFLPDQQVQYAFHPMDFTQINGPINRQIVSRVVELMAVQPGERVLDLFWVGNFTLPLAKQGAQVVRRGRQSGDGRTGL